MSKKCINCGAELPDEATFCPKCETVQTPKKRVDLPDLKRYKKMRLTVSVLTMAVCFLVLAIALIMSKDDIPKPGAESPLPENTEPAAVGSEAPEQSNSPQSGDELEAGLSATLARHMATIANAADFLARRTSHIEIYLTGGNLLFACLIIFSLTGIADNLYESYRSRRREFELYKICGMKNSALRTMKAAEIAITAGAGIIAGAVMAGVLTVLVSRWMFAYGVDLFCLLSLLMQ